MKLEDFLWRYCSDCVPLIVQIYESNNTIRLTSIFNLGVIDIFSNYDKFKDVLQCSVKDVEPCGDGLKITVWAHWIKFKED